VKYKEEFIMKITRVSYQIIEKIEHLVDKMILCSIFIDIQCNYDIHL